MKRSDELDQLLHNLHLGRIAQILEAEVGDAEKHQRTYADFLTRLLRAQWHHRQETALAWRIERARLPEDWTLESFPWKRQSGIVQREIRGYAELDFIPKAENIVFIGKTGVGKTGLACGLLRKAIQNGYRGLFIRAQDLFDEMYASLADRSSRKLLDRLVRVDLLVIDSCGVPGNVESGRARAVRSLRRRRIAPHYRASGGPLLQGLQPREDRGVRPPGGNARLHVADRPGLGDRLALHLEVDGGVAVGGVDARMAEPPADRDEVDTGPQEVDGGAVAHAVGMKSLGLEGGRTRTSAGAVLAKDVADAEAGEGLSPVVLEDRVLGCRVGTSLT
jgi:DNA replication protein DnaC